MLGTWLFFNKFIFFFSFTVFGRTYFPYLGKICFSSQISMKHLWLVKRNDCYIFTEDQYEIQEQQIVIVITQTRGKLLRCIYWCSPHHTSKIIIILMIRNRKLFWIFRKKLFWERGNRYDFTAIIFSNCLNHRCILCFGWKSWSRKLFAFLMYPPDAVVDVM